MCTYFVASNYQKVITDISFFFVLYWFAPFLKFGPLPSENPRCAPVNVPHWLVIFVVTQPVWSMPP